MFFTLYKPIAKASCPLVPLVVSQANTGSGGWEHFTIQAGTNFTGTFQYLVLTADDDATGNGNSYFRNLQIYEDYDDNLTCTVDISCPSILSLTNPVPTGIYSAGVEVNCNTTVDNLSSVKFIGGQVVKLENGFVAPVDTRFEANIGDCQ